MEFTIESLASAGLEEFARAIAPEENGREDNPFIVEGVEIQKVPHIPYLVIAQGNLFMNTPVAGHYTIRVENKTNGAVEVDTGNKKAYYLDLGKSPKATVVGVATAGRYTSEDGKVVRFIPLTKDTPIPAEWGGKIQKVTYVALYFPQKKVIAIAEGIRTKRRITDAVVEKILQKPAFYEVHLDVVTEKNDKGAFLAPKVLSVKKTKETEELKTLRELMRTYFTFRLEKTRHSLLKKTGVSIAIQHEDYPPQTNQTATNEDTQVIEEDDEDIPF